MAKTIEQLITSLDDFLIDGATLPAGGKESKAVEYEGTLENNIYGTGYVSLSWRASGADGRSPAIIPKGTDIEVEGEDPTGEYAKHTFVLPQAYVPVNNGDGTWTYSPKFSSVGERLEKMLFYIDSKTSDGKDIRLYTFYFSGSPSDIAEKISACMPDGGSLQIDPTCEKYGDSVYVSFDGDSVKSAAQKVATAMGAQILINESSIRISEFRAVSDEVYEQLLVFGGTRNMGKRTLADSDYYAALTQRLMLPETYKDSIYPESASGIANGKTTKLLIFDDIYPKMELTICAVQRRICFMYDEYGHKVVDHYEVGGQTTVEGEPVTADTPGAVPVYKQYAKWYIAIGFDAGNGIYTDDKDNVLSPTTDDGVNKFGGGYAVEQKSIIAGKPLGIVFQSGALMGREFDLAYFAGDAHEEMDDDAEDGINVTAGAYRIIMQADGSTLIPGIDTLQPAVGDKVSLVNVALDEGYLSLAQLELEKRVKEVAPIYMTEHETEAEYSEAEVSDDFLIDGATLPSQARRLRAPRRTAAQDAVVTSVKTDLATGRRTKTTGTFQPQGLLSSMVQKVDGVSLSGGSATMGSTDDYYRPTASMGIDQWKALQEAGGSLGMKSIRERVTTMGNDLGAISEAFEAVKEQSDRKFDVWFTPHKPSPYYEDGEIKGTANYPATEWPADDDKEQHLYDICYDTTREAAADGGRAYRWEAFDIGGETIYAWHDITDSDTLASLEKISDVAGDGKLSGGAEKTRVYIDWMAALEDYRTNEERSRLYPVGTEWSNYVAAFNALGTLLNGGGAIGGIERNDTDSSIVVTANGIALRSPELEYDDTDGLSPTDMTLSFVSGGSGQSINDQEMLVDFGSGKYYSGPLRSLARMAEDERVDWDTVTRVKVTWLASDSAEDYAWNSRSGLWEAYDDDGKVIAFLVRLTIPVNKNASWIYGLKEVPSWLEDLSVTTVIPDPEAYREAWNDYYYRLALLQQALIDAAKAQGDEALEGLADMADDDILTVSEKIGLRREWQSVVGEYTQLTADADRSHLDKTSATSNWLALDTAYRNLGSYLNDLGSTQWDGQTVTMLSADTDTAINGTTFSGLWNAWYQARADLYEELSTKNVQYKTGSTVPEPPYYIGDLWLNTATNTMMICRTSRTDGLGDISDWEEFTVNNTDPRSVLATLGDMVFSALDGTQTATATVTLAAQGSTISPSVTGVESVLARLYDIIGAGTLTITIGNQSPQNGNTWDLWCSALKFQVPSSSEQLTGGCQIFTYNDNGAWELIQRSVNSLLNNLGNNINAVVFGNSNVHGMGEYVEGAGLTTQQNFAKMFASAQMWDASANGGQGGMVSVAQALFGLNVELWYRLKNGTTLISETDYNNLPEGQKANYEPVYVSSAGLSADKINFTGKNIDMTGANSINLNAPTINLNAEKINWKGNPGAQDTNRYIIDNEENGQTVHKFFVDENGNVTMNDLEANNATIGGTFLSNDAKVIISHSLLDTISDGGNGRPATASTWSNYASLVVQAEAINWSVIPEIEELSDLRPMVALGYNVWTVAPDTIGSISYYEGSITFGSFDNSPEGTGEVEYETFSKKGFSKAYNGVLSIGGYELVIVGGIIREVR